MSQDNTRTDTARRQSKAPRMDEATRAAQARLADKSFSEFMQAQRDREGWCMMRIHTNELTMSSFFPDLPPGDDGTPLTDDTPLPGQDDI